MRFQNYGLWKTWLDNCLERPIWDDLSTENMVNGAKHCWNVNEMLITMFIDHCESNWVRKSLS